MVTDEFRGADLGSLEEVAPAGVKNKWASQEMADMHDMSTDSAMVGGAADGSDYSVLQEQVVPGSGLGRYT